MNSPSERPNLARNDHEAQPESSTWKSRQFQRFARSELQKQRERHSDRGRSNITHETISEILRLAKQIAVARPADWLTDADLDAFGRLAQTTRTERTHLVRTEQKYKYIAEAIERWSLPRGHFYNASLQSMVDDLHERAMSQADLPAISREGDERVRERARQHLRAAIRELDLETADPNLVFDVNDYRLQDIIQQGADEAHRSHTQESQVHGLELAFEAMWPDAPPEVRNGLTDELTEAIRHDWFDPQILEASLSIDEPNNSIASALVHRERRRYEIEKGDPFDRHLFDESVDNQYRELKATWKATATRRKAIVADFRHRTTPNIDERTVMLEVKYRLHRHWLLMDRLCLGPKQLSTSMRSYVTGAVHNRCRDWYRSERRRERPIDPGNLDDHADDADGNRLASCADGIEESVSIIHPHALRALPGCQVKASQALAQLCGDTELSAIDSDTKDICELLLELTLVSIEIYARWMQDEREDRAVSLLQLDTTNTPRKQLKSFRLLVSAAFGQICPAWFRRYRDGLPRDKSKEPGAFGSREDADYRRLYSYIVGRKKGTDSDKKPHPIIQKGVRGLLYEYLLDDLLAQTSIAIIAQLQEER